MNDSVKPEKQRSSHCLSVFHRVKYITNRILGVAKGDAKN